MRYIQKIGDFLSPLLTSGDEGLVLDDRLELAQRAGRLNGHGRRVSARGPHEELEGSVLYE